MTEYDYFEFMVDQTELEAERLKAVPHKDGQTLEREEEWQNDKNPQK